MFRIAMKSLGSTLLLARGEDDGRLVWMFDDCENPLGFTTAQAATAFLTEAKATMKRGMNPFVMAVN